MINEARDELISAALDGERVDVEALRGALASPGGQASLAAFVLLRAATAADDIAPAMQPEAREAAFPPSVRWRAASLPSGRRVPIAWAASLVLLAIAAAFWFGTSLRAPNASLTLVAPQALTSPQQAPAIVMAPTEAARAGHGPTGTPGRTVSPRVRPVAEQPPKPTRMLRFVPGVDWISTTQ